MISDLLQPILDLSGFTIVELVLSAIFIVVLISVVRK